MHYYLKFLEANRMPSALNESPVTYTEYLHLLWFAMTVTNTRSMPTLTKIPAIARLFPVQRPSLDLIFSREYTAMGSPKYGIGRPIIIE